MRLIWVTVLCGLFFLGCKHTRSGESSSPATAPDKTRSPGAKAGVGSPAVAPAKRQTPRVVPVNEPTGRVASVNPTLRFVVIDFYLSQLPPVGQLMSVYRQGQKVAQVKITGPERSSNIAADIVGGDAKVGDEVRVD